MRSNEGKKAFDPIIIFILFKGKVGVKVEEAALLYSPCICNWSVSINDIVCKQGKYIFQ